MDGSGEKRQGRHKVSAPVSSIFVHAGAGYHSTTNEHIHLGACNDAAKMAMRILRTGGSAVDAVEAAIKVLEDKEITNAGYGSNLTIDGVVECDATVVDHLGRSGACGAVSKVKNPINLARLILETSSRPLTLRRVPPNLLVGEGAADFAYEHGMPQVFHDTLISKNARERYSRWREDLKRAGGAQLTAEIGDVTNSDDDSWNAELEERITNKQRRDHTNALLSGTWNEGQPDSPGSRSPGLPDANHSSPRSKRPKYLSTPATPASEVSGQAVETKRPLKSSSTISAAVKRPRIGSSRSSDATGTRGHSLLSKGANVQDVPKSAPNIGITTLGRLVGGPQSSLTDGAHSLEDTEIFESEAILEARTREAIVNNEDIITDTVGAIAIDMFGNIAAGSSSGGIGMKHRGRVGPAALVGVGTSVIPSDPEDSDHVSVAAVTSGTGEHMATTMAAQKCAERLYFNTQRGRGATNVSATEEEAMESFVTFDFMDHPGVKNSHSAGAIGVMAVKKTSYGYFLHFAHNTDSFALASMHSNEKEAKCVMSRIGDNSSVVQGGRKIRVD